MTLHQVEALAIIAGMIVLLVSDRLRYHVTAALAPSTALLTGVVPAKQALEGFSSSVVTIIASVLVISRAVAGRRRPAIHVFHFGRAKDVDGRAKPCHDVWAPNLIHFAA